MKAVDPPVHETMLAYVEKPVAFQAYHLKRRYR